MSFGGLFGWRLFWTMLRAGFGQPERGVRHERERWPQRGFSDGVWEDR